MAAAQTSFSSHVKPSPFNPGDRPNRKVLLMKNRFVWAGALALATIANSQMESQAVTNGIVLITTRKSQDISFANTDNYDIKGPGCASPGDVAMSELLGDNGYSSRVIPDAFLNTAISNPYTGSAGDPDFYLYPGDPTFNVSLVILSGSSGSADVPFIDPTNGVPIMIGEHSCISDRSILCSCYMYSNGNSSANLVNPSAGQYMKVLQPHHPILEGIPLDAQGRIKIFRDAYPEENAHVPTGGKPNYEYSWTTQFTSNAAPGTTVLGVLDSNQDRAVFGVNDVGGMLSNGGNNTIRLVHFFVNEDGSGGSRRMFNALTVWGRILFVRTAKWAMGETVAPYQGFNIIDVGQVAPGQIKLRWQGSHDKNYRIDGTTDFVNWQPIVDSIPGGVDGVVSRTLNIASGPSGLFMRVAAIP